MVLRYSRHMRTLLISMFLTGLMAAVAFAHPDYKAGSRHKVKVKVYGNLESVDGSWWIVGGFKVRLTPNSLFEDDVEVGDYVRAKGFEDGDNNWVIKEIELKDRPEDGAASVEIKLTGRVQSMATKRWVVAGRVIEITDDTDIEKQVSIGDRVKIEADRDKVGRWIASEVDLKK